MLITLLIWIYTASLCLIFGFLGFTLLVRAIRSRRTG